MTPEQLAKMFNNMDSKGAANFASALNAMGAPSPAAVAVELAQRLNAILPPDIKQLEEAARTDPAALLLTKNEPLPDLTAGWDGVFRYLPLAVAIAGAAGAFLLAVSSDDFSQSYLTVLQWACLGCGVIGVAIGLIVKISRTADGGKAGADALLPAGGEVLVGGVIGVIVGAILGSLFWLLASIVGITILGALVGLGLGFLLRFVLFARPAKNLYERANQHLEAKEWDRARALYTRVVRLRAVTNDKAGIGLCLNQLGWMCKPDNDPAGNYNLAAAHFAKAAELGEKGGDASNQENSLINLGLSLQPDRNPTGHWNHAAAALARAALVSARVGNKLGRANCLFNMAWCVVPKTNPGGDWAVAAALYAEAAKAFEDAGNKKSQGHSLHHQAWCLHKGGAEPLTPEARDLFTRAARLQRDAGDEIGAKASETWLA